MESIKDVYMITLDALDLNMLPISQKLNEGRVVILGSKSSLGLRNKEYYELEIKTNDTREERNDQVIENVICHICDINVPKVYFNEHKNSFRHKFNAKIAHIVLRRIQLFMNKDYVNESYAEIPSKHYCSECSLVIDSDDESHKQSVVHRNSIFLEIFLNNFLKFYANDEQEINNSKDSKKFEVTKETKHSEYSKKGVDLEASNISETIIASDLKQDSKNIEVASETKHSEDSTKGIDSDASNILETIIVSDSNENNKNIEVANETKHSEDSKKGVDSDASNISETIIVSDSNENNKNIEVANETKHSEDSKKGVDLDASNISETIIVSDSKEDSKNIEVPNETKHSEDSKKGVDLDASNISETIIVSDSKEDSKNIEVPNETKHSEDSKKGVDLDASNISETIIVSDSKEDSKNIEVPNETKHSEDSKKGVDLDASNISETIIVSDSKEDSKNIEVPNETKHSEDSKILETITASDSKQDSKNIEVASETKHSEDSKKGVDLDASNISETIIVSDSKEDSKNIEVPNEMKHSEDSKILETITASDSKQDSKNIEVASETKHSEDSKKGVDLDASNISETIIVSDSKESNISETIIVSDSKEDGKNIEVASETKHSEDSKKGVDSVASNISETVIVSDSKEDSKISKRDINSGEENKKLDSSPILYKAGQVKDKVVDGGRFKATESNFNAVTKISSLIEYCIICDQIFAIEKRSLHLNSDLHCENLLQKLPNENCIRKVNNTQDHCILCNNNFDNYEVHINSEEHITNFKNMIIPDKCKKTAEICYNFNADKINVNTKSQNSEILKSNESKSSTDTNGHTAPLNNNKKKTEEIDECTDNIETGTAVNIELDHGDAIKTDKMDNATDSKVIDVANAIKTAVPGNATDSKVLDAANAIKTAVPGNATDSKVLDAANAIKTAVPGNATDSKVLDAANAIKTAVPSNATVSKVVDAANGKALKSVDNCGQLYKTASVNKIIATAKQSENTVKRGSQPYFCNVCQVQVPNNVNNISSHNKGIPHKLKLRQQVDSKVEETSNLHYQMVKTDTKNFVTCIVCDVDLHFNDKNISTHIKGWPHKNNYSEFCKRNLLVNWNNTMYCTVCRVNPGIRCEITHCNGENHKKNLENLS